MSELPPPTLSLNRSNHDEQLAILYFGNNDGKTSRVQVVHQAQVEVTSYYLVDMPTYSIKNGQELSCFHTNANTLAIFDIPITDIKAINAFCRHLLRKMKLKPENNLALEFDINETLFFRPDTQTTYWNKEGKRRSFLPRNPFHAKVSIKIRGLELRSLKKMNSANNMLPSYVAKLLIVLDQVCVTNEDVEPTSCNFV